MVDTLPDLQAPSSFICAFVKSEEAVDIVKKSPMTFKFVPEALESTIPNSTNKFQPVSVAAPIELHFVEGEDQKIKREQVDPSISQSDPIKTFTLWAKPSGTRYNHKTNIRRNPIHGPWPEAEKSDHDFTHFALKEVVPASLAQHGLCDWITGGQLSEDAKLARQEETAGGQWQIRDRIARRRNREKVAADKDELTSWKSIWDALRSRDDASTEASASANDSRNERGTTLGQEPFDEEYGSEIISEPLRMDDLQSQGLDSPQKGSGSQDSGSNEAPASDSQRDGGALMAKSAGSQVLPKILEMQTYRKAAPALDSGADSLHSESADQGDKKTLPLDHGKDT